MPKIISALFLLVAPAHYSVANEVAALIAKDAELCIERPENNGSINLLPSRVSFGQVTLELIGGQKQCSFVKAGKTEVRVSSKQPYHRYASDPAQCKSEPKVVILKKGETQTLAVWPTVSGASYTCGWLIK